MEDTTIFPGYYAYMLRVDISHNQIKPLFKLFKDKYKPTYYIVGAENGTMTDKPHIQGILWFESKISQTAIRQYWKRLTNKSYPNSVAITSAKKVQNLAKYCMKDGDFITNLLPDNIQKLGTWTQGENTYQFTIQLYDFCSKIKYVEPVVNWLTQEEDLPTKYKPRRCFIIKVLEFYKLHQKRPNKNTMDYLLFKYHYVTPEDLYQKWYGQTDYNNY